MTIQKGFSLLFPDWNEVEGRIPLLRSAGFAGVEPTFNSGAVPSPEDYRQSAPQLRKRANDAGLEIPSMRGGRIPWPTIPSPDPAERRRALDHTRRAFECLRLMGGKTLLVVPGQIDPDIPYLEHWKRVVEYGRQAGEIAREFDAILGLENVEARFPLSVKEWKDLIDEIDHPQVGMYIDVGNIVWLGLGYPQQWIEFLGRRIRQVHFKDAHFGGELRNLLAGEVDWQRVNGALQKIEYTGWVCVEPKWYTHAPRRLAERLSRDLDAILAL